MADNDTALLAGIIYGEAANKDYDTMKMVGSTVINRLKSGKVEEFGGNMNDVIMKGYYAAKNPNEPYKEVQTRNFKSPESIEKYKQAYAIAGGLTRGSIEPDKGLFYFTPKEETKLRKTPKVFNFKNVKESGKVGGYTVYDY